MPLQSRCRDTLAFAFLLCSSLLAQSVDSTWSETIYPGGDGAAGENEKWITIRAVDKMTGEAIPRAQLWLLAEAEAPVGGEPIEGWHVAADKNGFVAMRVDKGAPNYEPWAWLCVRAPGYCQHMRMGGFDGEVVALNPSIAVPVQVRDWRNQSVSGALVGFCSGCGHTPDLVHGVTGESGIATLPGVDMHEGIADFYVVHPDLELGYDSPIWAPGMQPVVMRLGAGVAHRGIVVDHEGLPVAGAAVGQSFVHRGPWTLSKADGTFVVSGLDSRTDLAVIHGNRKVIFACMGTDGLRLQLPKPNGESTVVVEVSEQAYARDAARTEQRKEFVEQREAAWPKVVVRTVGMPADGSVSLVTKHKRYVLDDAIALGKPVPLPDEEFVFLLRGDYDCERFVSGNREQAMRDGVVRLRWFADTILEGRIVDRDGEPVRASVRIESLLSNPDGFQPVTQDVAGALSLPTVLEGLHFLVIRERLTGAVRKLPIDIPRRGDDVVLDLGNLCLRERSQVTVLAPDGTAFTKGEVLMRRLGFPDWAFEFANEQWWGPDLLVGDCLMLAAELAPPADLAGVRFVDVASRFRVEGEGPWTFQQHGGELLLEIDADGAS